MVAVGILLVLFFVVVFAIGADLERNIDKDDDK